MVRSPCARFGAFPFWDELNQRAVAEFRFDVMASADCCFCFVEPLNCIVKKRKFFDNGTIFVRYLGHPRVPD
jgi:hypothetical protein